MSELREDIKKNDFIMDKLTKKLWFVVKISMHSVWIRDEMDKSDDPEIQDMPKHMINLSMIKVKPDVIKILYGDKNEITYGDDDINPST